MYTLQVVGGRKFIVALASIASASLLVSLGRIDAGIYSVVMVATAGAYMAANVTQKATAKAGAAP
ncbi:MAG: hypothetical protein HEQ39_09780 [Rhizobacter sp.]